jgi:hypothetical protein
MSGTVKLAPVRKDFEDRAARNPFSSDVAVSQQPIGAIANAEQQRSIAEVQARIMVARMNPRNAMNCMDAILRDCTRPSLAKEALYQYARGGSSISGPSIRLAESIARRWGNIASGIKEVGRAGGYSECVAYAWDLETGYFDERQFQIKHWRDTKQGGYTITDERDIYELVANLGQRRKRAVLLSVIPGDVIEAAVDQCEETLRASADVSPEALKRLVEAFAAFSVTQAQIEQRCQCRLGSIRPAQIVQLSKIYTSLNDGMSGAKDWFPDGVWANMSQRQASQPAGTTGSAPDSGGKGKDDTADRSGQKTERETSSSDIFYGPGTTAGGGAVNTENKAQDHEFEGWLADEDGEPLIPEPFYDPVAFVREIEARWQKSPRREALVENNRECLEAAANLSGVAKSIFSTIDTVVGDDGGALPVVTVQDGGRGGGWPAYPAAIGTALKTLDPKRLSEWIEVQMPTLKRCPQTFRMKSVTLIVAWAAEQGADVPANIRDIIRPSVKPATSDDKKPNEETAQPDHTTQQSAQWIAAADAAKIAEEGITSEAEVAKKAADREKKTNEFADQFIRDLSKAHASGAEHVSSFVKSTSIQSNLRWVFENYKVIYRRIVIHCATHPVVGHLSDAPPYFYDDVMAEVAKREAVSQE